MHNFHDAYKRLPPQSFDGFVGKEGRPLLSWRVAILPFIEQENMYRQFKLDEPWDSEHNKKLIAQMPPIYAVPGQKGKEKGLTHYQVFTGPRTPFPRKDKGGFGGGPVALHRIADGTANTLMVVEAAAPVIWTKPDDLVYDPQQPLPRLGGLFPGGFNAALCDGSVHFLPAKLDEQVLRNLITVDDGMVIPGGILEGREGRLDRYRGLGRREPPAVDFKGLEVFEKVKSPPEEKK